jgi:FlaA1/EpsC-like NDP-sugar epimerase
MIKNYFTYYSNKHVPYWIVFAIDVMTVVCAFYFSYLIRFDLSLNFELKQLLSQLPIVVLVSSLSFFIFGTYKNAVRYTGLSDIISLFKSVILTNATLGLFVIVNNNFIIIPEFTIPLSIVLIHLLISVFFLSFSRLLFKSYYKYLKNNKLSPRKVLVYGKSDASIMIYNTLINNVLEKVKVVGFINNGQFKYKKHINGLPIWHESKITQEFVKTNNIEEILISSESIDGNNSLISKDLKIKITQVAPLQSWVNGDLTTKLKQVRIEDLLGRPSIKINNTNVKKEFVGETLLITGAAGCVGKELVKQLINFDIKKLILIDQSETDLYDLQQHLKQKGKHNFTAIVADISDGLRIDMLFQEYRPNVVFHTAEYRNEQLMMKSPYEAIKININGTKFLADTSSRYNVRKFVFVSTNKVINSTSTIGVTKRLAELYITCLQKESKTKYITARCGNIVDSKYSLISNFEKQIQEGSHITISDKNLKGFFTTIIEAVELILEAGTMGKGGEVFVFDTGEPMEIYDLAKRMINIYELNCPKEIDIKVTSLNTEEIIQEELMATIERPVYSYHKKVMIFNSMDFNHAKIKSEIEELCFNNRFQHTDIVLKMKELITESKPNNSEYQHLYKRVQSYKKANGILPHETNQVKTN